MAAFYNLLNKPITEYNLIPENIHGTDKVGTNTANGERIGGQECDGPQYQPRGGNYENITIIVTISGNSSSIPPAVIYKSGAVEAG